ncbi:hypothetical protein BH09BAC1_BH09BAC1_22320 [soil metagenome]
MAETRKRVYHYIYDEQVGQSERNHEGTVQHSFQFKTKSFEIDSEDLFDEEIQLFAFPIHYLHHIDSILRTFGFREDPFYFFHQCKEVIQAPERHLDEKGNGKMSFQAHFHNFPFSVSSINDTAIVVVGLNVKPGQKEGVPKDYWLTGYIHANQFEFQPLGEPEKWKGYYYNMLRISERKVNGQEVYRRKKMFTMFFAILNDLVKQNDVHFIYASMGRENVAIKEALHRSAEQHGRHYERIPFRIFSKFNKFWGKRKYEKQLVNITHDEAALKKMYQMVHERMSHYLFYHHIDETVFLNMVRQIAEYSKSSGVWMTTDEQGNIKAATIAINLGDYFQMDIDNAKGILKIVQWLKLFHRFLYFTMTVGNVEEVDMLYRGLASYYQRNYSVQMAFLPSWEADPYLKVKKSFLVDEYIYFLIADRPEELERFKQVSKKGGEHMNLFVDQPII